LRRRGRQRRRRVEESPRDVVLGGPSFSAVICGGVGELNVLTDVVGRKSGCAVSAESGHGDLAVTVRVDDGSGIGVWDGLRLSVGKREVSHGQVKRCRCGCFERRSGAACG
jgi:hypothetical protein